MITVRVVTAAGTSCVQMTARELVEKRNALCKQAGEIMRGIVDKPKHVVFYHDERRDEVITDAWLYYNLVGIDDDTVFYSRTANINGLIGALHY